MGIWKEAMVHIKEGAKPKYSVAVNLLSMQIWKRNKAEVDLLSKLMAPGCRLLQKWRNRRMLQKNISEISEREGFQGNISTPQTKPMKYCGL